MKIDYEKMKSYADKNDEALWTEIRAMASKYGYTLPTTPPPHSDMERIRAIMTGKEKIGLSEGMKLLNKYKQSTK